MTEQLVPIRLKLPYATEEESFEKLAPALLKGSLFLGTRTPRPENTAIAFEFVLMDGRPILAGEGRITRISRDASRPGMTVAVSKLDARGERLLARAAGPAREKSPPSPAPSSPIKPPTLPAAAPIPPAPAQADPPPDPVAEERKRRRQAILDGPAPPRPARAAAGAEPVLGIDLGTTICRVAIWQDGAVKLLPLEGRSACLPSVVAFDDKGRLLIGTRAKAHVLVDPKSSIFGAKRLLGRRARSRKVRDLAARFPYDVCPDEQGDAAVHVHGKIIPITQIIAHLLGEVRGRASEALGREANRAVIGVPAYFNDRQRQAVRLAGKMAGLDVLCLLSEPTAVAIAFGFGKGLARKRLLVYDLGGGTFDTSILEATGDDFEVVAAAGDDFLGGLDFDARIASWLEERFGELRHLPLPADRLTRQRVRDAAESAKIALSTQPETRVHVPFVATHDGAPIDLDVPLDRPTFENLTRDLVGRSVDIVRTVFETPQITPGAIDEVLVVGGQSQSPAVRQALEGFVGKRARGDVDPHASVAIGAALVGRALQHGESSFTLRYEEMLTSTIRAMLPGGDFERVLDRGTRLPCEKAVTFNACADGLLEIVIRQGDSEIAEENDLLGRLAVPASPGVPVEVVFSVAGDGILTLSSAGAKGKRHELALVTADVTKATPEVTASAPAPADSKKSLLQRLFGRR